MKSISMNILGLNAYYGDVSAALLVDGQLRATVEEERFNRVKHCAGFPKLASVACLDQTGTTGVDRRGSLGGTSKGLSFNA
jgi:carbamoyltransferase